MCSPSTHLHLHQLDQLDWFPVDAAKTLSDQDLLGLKLSELGAFWMFRLFCWKDGSIPSSAKRLAVLCRSTEKQMERMLGRLSHLLAPHPERPDRLIMPTVEEDRPTFDETIAPPPVALSEAFSPQVHEEIRVDVAEASAAARPERPRFVKRVSDMARTGGLAERPSPPAVKEPESVKVTAQARTGELAERPSPPAVKEPESVKATAPARTSGLAERPSPPAVKEPESVKVTAPAMPPPARADELAEAGKEPEPVTTAATAMPPSAKRKSSPAEDTRTETPPEPEASTEPPKEKLSFFMEQESVFDAHEFGLCAFSEAVGEPDRFKPERHYRMKASRRRIVALAIDLVGLDTARQAARNLPLSLHLYDESDKFHPLDIERAFRDPRRMSRLFIGSDADLIEAIRERRNFSGLERERLLAKEPAPWQPPTPSEYRPLGPAPTAPPPASGSNDGKPQQSTFKEFGS